MRTPHPTDSAFIEAYSQAWSADLDSLLAFFAPEGTYTDVAMGVTYEGHEGITRFYRFMLKFAPDSVITFGGARALDGRLHAEWVWSGSFAGPLRLRSGDLVDATGATFSVPGIAACEYTEDGKLTSHRDFWDLGTVLDQTGVRIG